MKQQEIYFFWPLTEQIPLDLDYTGCERPKLTVPSSGITFSVGIPSTGELTINAVSMNIDVGKTTITVKQSPPWYRKVLFNLLGIKWEIK